MVLLGLAAMHSTAQDARAAAAGRVAKGPCPPSPTPHSPLPSLVQVRYVFKEHYGELPPYLRQRKAELEAARAAALRSQQAHEVRAAVQGGRTLDCWQRARAWGSHGAGIWHSRTCLLPPRSALPRLLPDRRRSRAHA